VAAVGGNLSKSSNMTVSGTISLRLETASNSVVRPVLREARITGKVDFDLKMKFVFEE
jgi:hypothetical protein